MRPWKTASRKQIAYWIRDVAMDMWEGGSYANWEAAREADGWTEDDIDTFIRDFQPEIREARIQFKSWIDGILKSL